MASATKPLAEQPQLLPSIEEANPDRYMHLMQRLETRKNDLITSLSNPDFYFQLLFLAVAFLLARYIAWNLRHRLRAAIRKRPSRHLDPQFMEKPLSMIRPVLVMFLFTFGKIGFALLDIDSGFIDAALKLAVAYIMAKAVLLVVHNKGVARFIAWVIMIVASLKAMKVMRSINGYLESLAIDLGNFHISLLGVMHGVVVLVVVFWVATALSQTLESYLRRSTALSYNAREIAVKCFKLFVYFMALFITLNAMGVDLTAFAVFGGALGVGIGLGLQKLTSNFVSSVTLLMEKSIKINDLIEVSGYTGWVRKLNTRYALLETFDGREVMIPNEVMVSTNLTNWTHTSSSARIEIKVTVDYKSDPVKAQKLILEAAAENANCMKEPAPSCSITAFNDNGIAFSLTFWIADIRKGRGGPQSDVMFAILKKFSDAGIDIGQPQPAAPPPAEATI